MESNYDFYVAIKAIKNGVDVGFSNEVRVKGIKNNVQPLLSTRWNQLSVPIDLDGDGALTKTEYVPGCSAVAVGQLINYYHTHGYERNWLDSMLSNVHVYPKAQVCNSKLWGLLNDKCEMKSFDLTIPAPGYTLLQEYATSNDENVNDFLFKVALGLDSEFNKCGSGGFFKSSKYGCATGAGLNGIDYSDSKDELLKKYGFETDIHIINTVFTLLKDRFRFSLGEPIDAPWSSGITDAVLKKSITFIESELSNAKPILLALSGEKSGSHLAVIDGYRFDANGKPEFHINFGWGENDCNTSLWRSPFESTIYGYPRNNCTPTGINEAYKFNYSVLLPVIPMR